MLVISGGYVMCSDVMILFLICRKWVSKQSVFHAEFNFQPQIADEQFEAVTPYYGDYRISN